MFKQKTKINIYKKILVFLLIISWVFSGWPSLFNIFPPQIHNVLAINYLDNPSFTLGTTNWTLSVATYDNATYQDTEGSVQTYAGRRASATGLATQNSYDTYSSADSVILSGYWQVTITGGGNVQLLIEIANENTPNTWVTIWDSGSITASQSWTYIDNVDVSSYFGTGSYRLRLRMQVNGGTPSGAESYAWFDNMSLDVSSLSLATVTTQTPDPIGSTTATGNGTITDTGGEDCTKRGFVYGLSSQSDPGNVAPGSSGYSNLAEILVDNDLNSSADSAEFRTDGTGQDWYESREDSPPNGANQLVLDTEVVGGNNTKKARFDGTTSYNTYMSQALPSAITSGTFVLEYYIYVDSIADTANDVGAFTFLGNDSGGTNGPNSTDSERWMVLGFKKSGGGDTGQVSFIYNQAANTYASPATASSTMSLDQWYKIKIVGYKSSNTYDIYVDDILEVSGAGAKTTSVNPEYISFATWNDGASVFYVDNISLKTYTGTMYVEDTDTYTAGSFTKEMTGLNPGTTYYVRAYAYNSGGYSYGGEVSFLTKPAAPIDVYATDGYYTDKVTIYWTKSNGATGYRVYQDGDDVSGLLGVVSSYEDTSADAPYITAGDSVAGDGTNANHVSLSLSGTVANNGTTHTYKVVASNATGNSSDSSTDTGYRDIGDLTFQWHRSEADNIDSNYSSIIGATTENYNDTGAPENGDARYYKCVLNATGAQTATSTPDRGYRATAAASVTLSQENFDYGTVPNNNSSSTLTLWGGIGIVATNTGTGTADFDIYGANSTGSGGGWTLSSGNTGNNYIHKFCNDTDNDCSTPPTNYYALSGTPAILKTSILQDEAVHFQLQITTPVKPTDLSTQSAVVTIQASSQ